VVLLVAAILVTHCDAVLAAVLACPPWVIVGATFAHASTLVLRTEAWRTVLEAAGSERLNSEALHCANAGSFLVGTMQSHAALPARIALLRRFGGGDVPVSQIALADAPIFMLEVCTTAVLAGIAATAVQSIPAWTPVALLAGAVAILCALRLVHLRFRHRTLTAGLAVLAEPGPRNRLIAIVLAFTVAALLRTWVVLIGFGLPSGPTDAALLLFSMGAIGLLPLGAVGTAPTATIAAMGATNMTAAAAAGMVIGTSTVLAVLIYAGACWTWWARPVRKPAEPELAEVVPLPLRGAQPEAELDLAA
jgi:lysylphosphatidylglycerol synthase-like protein